MYGRVTVEQFDGKRLPLIDNLANVVLVADPFELTQAEIRRVLCPGGSAFVRRGGKWSRIDKPRPDQIDVWTHFLHDASNNAVAHDELVDSPRRLQWTAAPRYSRHHDHMASVSAMVSNGPLVFTIVDMGSRWSIELPADWQLVARDAFNGTRRWTRAMGDWFTHHYALKSGPADLPRRLVAVDNHVYFTPSIDAPLEKLDAATGETLMRYESTAATEEIICHNDTLFLKVNRPDNQIEFDSIRKARQLGGGVPFNLNPRRIMAVDVATGHVHWQRESTMMPGTLAADARRVYFHDGHAVVCLARETGDRIWEQPVDRWATMKTCFTPTLVVYQGVVLFAGGENMRMAYGGKDSMTAMDAESGRVLWKAYHPQGGYMSAEDVLVAGGLVWSGETSDTFHSGRFIGRDPRTGEVRQEFEPDVDTYWFHHRCHRGKATDRFLLMSRTGIEVVDPVKRHWDINHWVRGGCLYGVMPCNGMIYTPPSNCACYPETKLFGFNALAPANEPRAESQETRAGERLERGPAFAASGVQSPASSHRSDVAWPTYRGDNGRSGCGRSQGPTSLDLRWTVDLQGRLTPPTVADRRVYVASIDAHRLYAVSQRDGSIEWTFTAGGRIDSPPTWYGGALYFGSADGYVYCLRARDGQLAWRYLVAPRDRRLVAEDQVESVWPVRGSVLIQNDRLYAVAGRSVFLDGGLRLAILDPASGRLNGQQHYDDSDPMSGGSLQDRTKMLNMPVGLNDILTGDGRNVYLKSQTLDKNGRRIGLGPHSTEPDEQGSVQTGETAHLFAPFDGFRDGDWMHRSYWVYGRSFAGGHTGYHQAGRFTPCGRILCFDEKHVYGFGRKPEFYKWTTPLEYQLFCADKVPRVPDDDQIAILVPGTSRLDFAKEPFAVEAWIKAAHYPQGVVLAHGGPQNGFALTLHNGVPRFVVRIDGALHAVTAGETNVVGDWHHLAATMTRNRRIEVYVDGRLAGSQDVPSLLPTASPHGVEIGSDEGARVGDYPGSNPAGALIDDIKLYLGSLRAEEIARHRQQGASDRDAAEAELVFHATFDDGTASDSSGKQNHGSVNNLGWVKGKFGKAIRTQPHRHLLDRKSYVNYRWTREVPLLVRAMAKADDRLYIMGPPDVFDEVAAYPARIDSRLQGQMSAQEAAIRGEQGAILMTLSTRDGAVITKTTHPELPCWDGMAIADGRLFVTTEPGKLVCLGQ